MVESPPEGTVACRGAHGARHPQIHMCNSLVHLCWNYIFFMYIYLYIYRYKNKTEIFNNKYIYIQQKYHMCMHEKNGYIYIDEINNEHYLHIFIYIIYKKHIYI